MVKMARLTAVAALALTLAGRSDAQELRIQPIPCSVYLDFPSAFQKDVSPLSLPIWMESFRATSTPATETAPEKTNFRIRLRRMGQLNSEIQMRLYFDDRPGFAPQVSGWTETGKQLYTAPALGHGLNLPGAETLNITVADLDYIDVDVPGDGSTVRRAFLTTLKNAVSRQALDFEMAPSVADPFSAPNAAEPGIDDRYLFGRVKATIATETFKLTPTETPRSTLEFELNTAPLMAVVSFEVLNADPVYPPELSVNNLPQGRVSMLLPDLADPGYRGTTKALETGIHFNYSGWVRCQQVIPGTALQGGLNSLVLELNAQSGPIGIRAVEIELKHAWKQADYPSAP